MRGSRSWICVLGTIAFAAGLQSACAAGPGVLFFDAYAMAPQHVGDSLQVRGVLFPAPLPPPLPLDFDEFEHTVVFAPHLVAIGDAVDFYAATTIAVYSDVRATGTRADPAQPGTYTDGDCILLARLREFVHSNFGSPGYAAGHFELTGGSRLDEVVFPPSILSVEWSTGDPSTPTGYQEVWLGQMYPLIDGTEQRTWSAVKALYREGAPEPR